MDALTVQPRYANGARLTPTFSYIPITLCPQYLHNFLQQSTIINRRTIINRHTIIHRLRHNEPNALERMNFLAVIITNH